MLEKQFNMMGGDGQLNFNDSASKEDKMKKQQIYKEILDQQRQFNQELQGYGNMTNVEKAMNREDLIAYKHFDNN